MTPVRGATGSSRGIHPSPRHPMNKTLATARHNFTEALRRQTSGSDVARYVAILDALLAWSERHPEDVTLQPPKKDDTLRFVRAGGSELFWSAQVLRDDAPMLELHLSAARAGSAERRADAMRTLNAHSRHELVAGDRLRIGFGALKNAAALAAVLALMDGLLAGPAEAEAEAKHLTH